jgi:hypothetical protein
LWRIVALAFGGTAAYLLGPWSKGAFLAVPKDLRLSRGSLQLLNIPFFRIVTAIFLLFLAWVFWSFPKDGKPRIKGRWYWN